MADNHVVESLFSLLDETGTPVTLDAQGQIPKHVAMDMIPLKDWAARNGITAATARQKALRGGLKTARKVGRDWMISASEINPDHRAKLPMTEHPALEGPVWFNQVLNYLAALDSAALPDHWSKDNTHEEYCRQVFLSLRKQLNGNSKILFDLLCDAMERQPDAHVYFLPHEEIMKNIEDEAWHTSNHGSDIDSGVTIDFHDYELVLANTATDLLSHFISLKTHHKMRTLMMPWYHSLTWQSTLDDGVYFVPSDFFKAIFFGLD